MSLIALHLKLAVNCSLANSGHKSSDLLSFPLSVIPHLVPMNHRITDQDSHPLNGLHKVFLRDGLQAVPYLTGDFQPQLI